jgi:hypothetical protein
MTTSAWGTDAPPRPTASPSPGLSDSRPSAAPGPSAPSSAGSAEPAFTVKMPLGCSVVKGDTVPGKPSSFAVVRPTHPWESPPVAIRITVHARDFEEPNLAVPSANKVITKTQMFYPARTRWSPNQSLSIDLGVKYPSPFTGVIGEQAFSIPSMAQPKCEATYEVARHTRP